MGVGAAVAAGTAVAGAAASAGSGAAAAAASEKIAKQTLAQEQAMYERDAAEREKYSQMIQGEADLARMQTRATEQTAMNLFGALGAPGTYDAPSQYGGPLTSLGPRGLTGIMGAGGALTDGQAVNKSGLVTAADVALKGGKSKWKGSMDWALSDTISDPDKLTASIMNTSGFRTVSKLVADAEQMMNKQGPLWNELNNSVIGSIYQSSAATTRQALAQASEMIARKGGAARRGMDWVNTMMIQQGVNNDRTNTLWQAKLGLEQWTRQNAMQVQQFAQGWVYNQAGVRDSYNNLMVNLRTFWSQTWPVAAAQVSQKATADMADNLNSARDAQLKASNDKYAAAAGGITSITNAIGGLGMMGSSNTNLQKAGAGMLAGGYNT